MKKMLMVKPGIPESDLQVFGSSTKNNWVKSQMNKAFLHYFLFFPNFCYTYLLIFFSNFSFAALCKSTNLTKMKKKSC